VTLLLTSHPEEENKLEKEPQRKHQLVPGQIVAAQLLHQASVLGITPDDELWGMVESETSAALRPAVVLKTWIDEDDGLERVTLAALARGKGLDSGPSVTFEHGQLETVPPWTLDETYCYVFPQPVSYVVSTVQVSESSLPKVLSDNRNRHAAGRYFGLPRSGRTCLSSAA
jgi:hypothetical protein